MPIKFRFGWIPFIGTMVAVAIGISLGQWQMRRAAEKEAIEQRLNAREAAPQVLFSGEQCSADEMEYRRVVVRGEFVPEWTVYLDNRPHNGAAGFYVMTPLKVVGTNLHVLVARGWAKRDMRDRAKLPPTPMPTGIIEIQGVARNNPGRLLQLGSDEPLHQNAILQNLDVQTFAQHSHLTVAPFIVEQSNNTKDGLVRDWPRPSSGVDKHRGYAFQWYALAATAFVFFLVTGLRRGRA